MTMQIKVNKNIIKFVTVNDFLLSDKLVTYDLWTSIMSSDTISLINSSRNKKYPIYGINFEHILEFLNILNTDFKQNGYYFDILNLNEWNTLITHLNLNSNQLDGDSYFCTFENSLNKVHKVARKKPVSGIYDVLGNVMEWCHFEGNVFTFDKGEIQPAVGGSYDDTLEECLEARFIGSTNQFNEIVGFRLGLFSNDKIR